MVKGTGVLETETHERQRDHTVAISRRSLPRPPKSKATKTRQSSGGREGGREGGSELGEKQATPPTPRLKSQGERRRRLR